MTRAWEPRRASAEDIEAVLEMLGRAHADDETGAISRDEWAWLYLDNPADSGLRYAVADAGNRLAGQYATLPMRVQIGGQSTKALLSLNTATDPDFQRQGVMTTLASMVYSEGAPEFAMVYGFPNARSAPGLYGRLGWQQLGFPTWLIRPLRYPGRAFPRKAAALGMAAAAPLLDVATLRPRKTHVEALDGFGDWANEIWDRAAGLLGTAAVRDAAFLRWRFDASPRDYRAFVAMDVDGQPAGYAVTRLVPWRNTTLGYLMELQGAADVAGELLRTATIDARAEGAVAICTIAAHRHPHRRALRRAGFLALPVKLSHELSLGVRILNEAASARDALEYDSWYLSPADFDWI
ncbi:MAG TPA: GNAT family N-acetyltransferase [Gaiellaceae bacterium]|jgi:GNAT superfamily N-acetyltransferase|nr:GNAT family N-acetyltransferase [Gaiellaceae bacterium]